MYYLEIDVVSSKVTLKTTKKTYLSIDLFIFNVCPNQMEVFSQLRINDFGQSQRCRCPVPPIRFCTRSSTHILSHREASASAQKAWSSAGRRGPRFGVGAGVCLGWAAGAGEGWVHAWGEGIGGVAIDVYGYGYGYGGWRGRLAYGWAWA